MVEKLTKLLREKPDQWSFIRTYIDCQIQRYLRMRDERASKEAADAQGLTEQAISQLEKRRTELAVAVEEAGTLRKQGEDLIQQLRRAERDNRTLRGHDDKEKQDLKARIEGLRNDVSVARRERDEAKQEAADVRDLAEQAASQWEEALAQGTDLATAAEEAGRLREQMADVEVLTNKLAATEQQLERAKETNQKLQSSIDTERQELKGKIEGLRSNLQVVRGERDEAKNEAAEAKELTEQATSKLSDMITQGNELAAAAKEAGTLRKRVEDLTQQLTGAKQEAADARDLAEQATSQWEEALARETELTAAVQEAGGLQIRSGAQ